MKKLMLTIAMCIFSLSAEAADKKSDSAKADMPLAEFVAPQDTLPYMRYFADGKTTLNDRCPVRLVKLNPKMGASYVNNEPVGFC